jgi:hypothetical protein
MGIFTQRPSAYTPPLDGGEPKPTLVGGGQEPVPERQPDEWQIELRRLPILHRGHAVLVLRGPNGEMEELNGLAQSRNTGQLTNFGLDGMKLVAQADTGERPRYAPGAEPVAVLATGSREQIVNGLWARAKRAAQEINDQNFDYKGHDPAYEFGGSGGAIQNSNSVAYTLSRAMGFDPDKIMRDAGVERRFSGWGRDLLDTSYKRYVAPPQFAAQDAP